MALLTWSEDLLTGIRAIDNDHKMLVDIINGLYDCVHTGAAESKIDQTLDALVRYVEAHFEREEKFMYASHYPGTQAHVKEHQAISRQVYNLLQLYRADIDTLRQPPVWEFLSLWLFHHIRKSDMHYVPYLQGQKAGKAPDESTDLRTVTVRVPGEQVDAILRCAAVLSSGGARADALLRTIAEN